MLIKDKLKLLPNSPGIYKFLDKNQKVIYVGKAKDLKKRVQNYFQASTKHGPKNQKLIENALDFEWIETNSEVEAILLETNFIKELRPKYNILMKDDKNFVYIKITLDEDFPRVLVVRQIEKDGAKYFGPKTSKTDVEKTLKLLSKIFPFRDCNYEMHEVEGEIIVKGAVRNLPCLQYHIKKCLGPCIGKVGQIEYRGVIEQILFFLNGKTDEIEKRLKQEMMQAAQERKFERASKLRDNLFAVQNMMSKQIISEANFEERDVFAFVHDLGKTFFTLLQIRGGKMMGQEHFILEGEELTAENDSEILEAFLKQYYANATDVPQEILLPMEIVNIQEMKIFLSELGSKVVKLLIPQIGKKNALVGLAQKNAESYAKANRIKWMEERSLDNTKLLEELQTTLKLDQKIKRIECFDISHLGGTDTVGSMVVFQNGKPQNSDYRHFKLRSLEEGEIDDFKAMQEVLARRLKYLVYDEKESILGDNYMIRRAKKSDVDFILQKAEEEELDTIDFEVKDFLVIEKSLELEMKGGEKKKKKTVSQIKSGMISEIVGFGRIKNYSEKVNELGTIWVAQMERGNGLGTLLATELMRKSKLSKIYAVILPKGVPFYARLGFQEIYQIPREIEERILVRNLDLKKYKYLAFIKSNQVQIDKSFKAKPDLIVIDGGKGQLGVVQKVLDEFQLKIPCLSLAKKEEEIYLPQESNPVPIPNNSEVSFLIQRIRDESHRFAITFNRELRSKRMVESKLDEIPGLGPKLKQTLLQRFGSIEGIKEAGEGELIGIVGKGLAKILRAKL